MLSFYDADKARAFLEYVDQELLGGHAMVQSFQDEPSGTEVIMLFFVSREVAMASSFLGEAGSDRSVPDVEELLPALSMVKAMFAFYRPEQAEGESVTILPNTGGGFSLVEERCNLTQVKWDDIEECYRRWDGKSVFRN